MSEKQLGAVLGAVDTGSTPSDPSSEAPSGGSGTADKAANNTKDPKKDKTRTKAEGKGCGGDR